MCYFVKKKILVLIQVLCLSSHLYAIKVIHGTTQEQSEEDQSEDDARNEKDNSEEDENHPDYEEDFDYTKFFHKNSQRPKTDKAIAPFHRHSDYEKENTKHFHKSSKKPKSGKSFEPFEHHSHYEKDVPNERIPHKKSKRPKSEGTIKPFDLSEFFRDVDAGKYNRKNKLRSDPSWSESTKSDVFSNSNITFPDFFDVAATNSFAEIVEQETDRHVGPAMSQDFDRLVQDIDFDIDMQEDRRRHVRSAVNVPVSILKDKRLKHLSNFTSETVKKDANPIDIKSYAKRKQREENKNKTMHLQGITSTKIVPNVSDIIDGKFNNIKTIPTNSSNDTRTDTNQLKNEYASVIEKLKKEMNDKITKSNLELIKTLNDSNSTIRNKIQQFKEEPNITNTPNANFIDRMDVDFSNNNMSTGDSSISPKFVTLQQNKKSSEELNKKILEQLEETPREIPRKRYASDAYFPEVEDYPLYDSNADERPNYDDYESSSQAYHEPPKSKSYNSPSTSYDRSPYNPQNTPPSSSFAHMYRTFDNNEPISTHYSTNHEPNPSSYESKGNYKSEPETYEPYNNYKNDPPSYGGYGMTEWNEKKSKNSKPDRMVEVEGDSPDMEYQTISEPKNDNIELDENGFDIDKFISDFNTDPPYAVKDKESSDEGEDEEEEEEGEGESEVEDETREEETESRPQEYTYKKTLYGSRPKENNFVKAYEKTRSSDYRPKKSSNVESSYGPNNYLKDYFKENEEYSSGRGLKAPVSSFASHQKKSKPTRKCVKTTKTIPGGKKKMKCKLCENLKTGGKSEHCSYLVNPNKDNYVVGTEEVTYRSIKEPRRKRYIKNVLAKGPPKIFHIVGIETVSAAPNNYEVEVNNPLRRSKREFDYDEDDEEDEDDKDENIEAEYGPEYDPYFGEPVGYKSSDGGSCRTVFDDDGAECRVCRNKKTNGEFKECSYASKPQKSAYEFGTSKVYGSGKSPRFRRDYKPRFRRSESKDNGSPFEKKYLHLKTKKYKSNNNLMNPNNNMLNKNSDLQNTSNSSHLLKLKINLLGNISKGENRANEEVSKEDIDPSYKEMREHSERKELRSAPNSNEGAENKNNHYFNSGNLRRKYRKRGYYGDEEPADSMFRERKSSDLYNDHFSQTFPELLDGRESLEHPLLKKTSNILNDDRSDSLFSNRNSFSNGKMFSSRSLLSGDGFKSKGLLDDKKFFNNNKLKLGYRFSDTEKDAHELFNDDDSDNLNRMFGEFAAKDRTNCKKRLKDKMTCYACVDENNVRQEECIYIKNSEPEAKQVAYQETNQYNNPKAQSSEGRESRIYSSPAYEMEDEYEAHPDYETPFKKYFHKNSESDERPSKELDFDIQKKSPKYQLGSIQIGSRDDEVQAIQNMDIQKVSKGKSKPNGKKREQYYSGSSHFETVETPDSSDGKEELFDASVSGGRNGLTNNSSSSKVRENGTLVDTQGEGSLVHESLSNLEEEPEEPETEGPDGAFSEETRSIYDSERKLILPKYMVEKSEGERIFDEISGM